MKEGRNTKIERKALSARAVESMRPGDSIKADTGENSGLRVRCGSTGAKTFFYRYTSPLTGRLTQIKVGVFPDMSLAEARVKLQELKAIRRTGQCPKALQDQARVLAEAEKREVERKKAAESFTVKDLVELYLTECIEDRMVIDPRSPDKKRRVPGSRNPKGQREVRRTLEGDPIRVLGKLPASDVTRKAVVDMVMAIVKRGSNVQAGSVLRELCAAYEYAIGLDYFDESFANPALLAKSGLRQAKVKLTSNKGKRVLSDQELAELMRWLPGSGYSVNLRNILWLALWTGCRTGEICAARWRDIDLEKGVWHIRETKNGAERYVQLPRQAAALLSVLRLNSLDYVFPSPRSGGHIQQKALSETKWHLKNPEQVKNGRRFTPEQLWLSTIDDWSPHDLRRSVRTGLSRLGCRSEVAEAVLGHSRKGIEGTYDLHAYEAECRVWLQKWADHLDGLLG